MRWQLASAARVSALHCPRGAVPRERVDQAHPPNGKPGASRGRKTSGPATISRDSGVAGNQDSVMFHIVRTAVVATAFVSFCIFGSAARAANVAPTISGTPPAIVYQGFRYLFVPTANDRSLNLRPATIVPIL